MVKKTQLHYKIIKTENLKKRAARNKKKTQRT